MLDTEKDTQHTCHVTFVWDILELNFKRTLLVVITDLYLFMMSRSNILKTNSQVRKRRV